MRIIRKTITPNSMALLDIWPSGTQRTWPALYLIILKAEWASISRQRRVKFASSVTRPFASTYLSIGLSEETHIVTGGADPGQDSRPEFLACYRGLAFLAQAAQRQQTARRCLGYCMAGRIAIISSRQCQRKCAPLSVTIPPWPTSRLQRCGRSTKRRGEKFRCPSINLYARRRKLTTVLPVQEAMYQAFKENGQPLECISFPWRPWLRRSRRARITTPRTAICPGRWWPISWSAT